MKLYRIVFYENQRKIEIVYSTRKEVSLNDLLKIEWEYLVSPINLKDITEKINISEYNKYFIVLDKDELKRDLNLGDYSDIVIVTKPDETINSSR